MTEKQKKPMYGIVSSGRKKSRGRWAITSNTGDGRKVVVTDLRFKQARRRAAGLNRGEMDLSGKTIAKKDRQ